MRASMSARAQRLPLAARLLALGVVQLTVLGAAAVAIGVLTRPPPLHDLTSRIDDAVADVAPLLSHGAGAEEIQTTLVRLATEHGLSFALYDADRVLVASSSTPAVPMPMRPPGPPRSRPGMGPPGREGSVVLPRGGPPERPLFDIDPRGEGRPRPPIVRWMSDGHALVARGESTPQYLGPLLTALVGLLVIAAGAWWMARWIVTPLERVAEAAERVGRGELGARTGLDRGDELGTVARGFDHMAGQIEQMLKAERELLANVSHELRTPLARLRVALDLASEGHTDVLADVTEDLQELEGIVDDVLLAFRFDKDRHAGAGLPVGTLRDTTADELVSASQRRFVTRHPKRPLEVTIDDDAPHVLADLAMLRRALDNVLDNADKYSPDPSAPISVHARRDGSDLLITVRDRGLGIDAADLLRIFEPFFRAERSRVRSAGGVGLGLALSRRIIEAHSGAIDAVSQPGEGSVFTIRLATLTAPAATITERDDKV